jgi:hypothetical protein
MDWKYCTTEFAQIHQKTNGHPLNYKLNGELTNKFLFTRLLSYWTNHFRDFHSNPIQKTTIDKELSPCWAFQFFWITTSKTLFTINIFEGKDINVFPWGNEWASHRMCLDSLPFLSLQHCQRADSSLFYPPLHH